MNDRLAIELDRDGVIRMLDQHIEKANSYDGERHGALAEALADCVVNATPFGEQEGGFIATYILPTGPIHRAIALLDEMKLVVRPGYDGRLVTDPDIADAAPHHSEQGA